MFGAGNNCSREPAPIDSSGRSWKLLATRHLGMIRNTVAHRILLLFAGLVLCSGCLIDRIGGAFTKAPKEFERSGSSGARNLVDEAFAGIDPSRLVDFHTPIIAICTTGRD